jgi:hypothetical protein
MNTETPVAEKDKALTTADLAAAQKPSDREPDRASRESAEDRGKADRGDAALDAGVGERKASGATREDEQLAALFPADIAGDFRSRWDAVQIGFVDDPRRAVQQADELVAQVMKNLAESFAAERSRFEQQMNAADGGASTENLRVALRRYRSFFERLLTL